MIMTPVRMGALHHYTPGDHGGLERSQRMCGKGVAHPQLPAKHQPVNTDHAGQRILSFAPAFQTTHTKREVVVGSMGMGQVTPSV